MPTMLYDADCGFCTRSAARVHRLGVKVGQASIQESDLKSLGVDEERAYREMPFVGDDGQVSYGHLAWSDILKTGPAPARLLGRLIRGRHGARVYRWVSEHRTQLPGGTPQCALPRD